ncbi:N-acetylglucosamine-6-phosphate deacetylase [Streptomyces misionensis JCM 4497]
MRGGGRGRVRRRLGGLRGEGPGGRGARPARPGGDGHRRGVLGMRPLSHGCVNG